MLDATRSTAAKHMYTLSDSKLQSKKVLQERVCARCMLRTLMDATEKTSQFRCFAELAPTSGH